MPGTQDDKRRDSGFTQLAAVMAVLLSMTSLLAVAFKLDNSRGEQVATAAMPMHRGVMSGGSGGVVTPSGESVKLVTVRVTVYNYDDMPHSFTADQLGVNATTRAAPKTSQA